MNEPGNLAQVTAVLANFAATAPDEADVAKAIVQVVDMPFRKLPFRVHIDPAQNGAEIANGVGDRVRAEMSVELFADFSRCEWSSIAPGWSANRKFEQSLPLSQSYSLQTASLLYTDISIGLNTLTFLSSANRV
jgi:hypothetical protein